METAKNNALPIVGIIFLITGVFEFINGDPWVVWIILGFLFGGLGVFNKKKKGSEKL